jgi:hypothetical protein
LYYVVSPDDGPFIGPSVEIRGKKNKKKIISFLPPVYPLLLMTPDDGCLD